MRSVAIIDIGSNNIKLEIHEVNTEGSSELIYAEKVAARLGHEVFITHRLAEKNVEAAIYGISQFMKIIKNMNCEQTIALGTAALRESKSKDFLERAKKECGIKVNVISGIEEARLVYLGTLANLAFKGRTFFLNDIGGGSTEISISSNEEMHYVESLPLGTVRLKELFEFDQVDKVGAEWNNKVIRNYVEKIFKPFHLAMKQHSFGMGISTGGTARNLMEIIKLTYPRDFHEESGIPILETSALKKLVENIQNRSLKEVAKLKGIDKQRVDIIIPGGILLLHMLETLKVKQSFILTKGLRDGALSDFIHKKVNRNSKKSGHDISRQTGIQKISNKYNLEKQHAWQCADLASQLFDVLQKEHKLDLSYKDILFGGALLHDIGSYISYRDHHKHSEYLIMNSELLGFSAKERHWISLIARYHRKGFPKASHEGYQNLSQKEKDMILKLSSIVRIADSLDRSYQSLVKGIRVQRSNHKKISLGIQGDGDLSLELWSVNRKKKYFEKTFGKMLDITVD